LRWRKAARLIVPSLLAIVVVVVVWWAISTTSFFDDTLLPSPGQVWDSLTEHWADGTIPEAALKSLIRLAFGMALAIVVGTLLGMAMAARTWVQRSLGFLVLGLRVLPPVAWAPLAILWFGLTERAVVFVVIIGAFPSIALGTASAIRQVPVNLVRAARTMGASGWTLYRRVVLPAAFPGYLTGIQQAWGFAWWSLMAAELLAFAAGQGLGHFLDRAGQQFDSATVVALMVVIVTVGMLVDITLSEVDRHVRRRRGLLAPSAIEA
jgi:NitT/TauT family transport system permease protein